MTKYKHNATDGLASKGTASQHTLPMDPWHWDESKEPDGTIHRALSNGIEIILWEKPIQGGFGIDSEPFYRDLIVKAPEMHKELAHLRQDKHDLLEAAGRALWVLQELPTVTFVSTATASLKAALAKATQ